MGDDHTDHIDRLAIGNTKAFVILPCIGLAVLLIHFIGCCWSLCGRQGPRAQRQQSRQHQQHQQGEMLELENLGQSAAQFIPAHKYERGLGLVADDGTCPVCLSQFEEGEDLRTLPECRHSYHASCIDMWLYSHPNCPMCRSDAAPMPLPQIFLVHPPNSGSRQSDSGPPHLDSGLLST